MRWVTDAKKFFYGWLVPPKWMNLLRRMRRGIQSKGLDKRRYWLGEDIRSPAVNVPGFIDAGLKCTGITIQNETRDCTLLRPHTEISMNLSEMNNGYWRFGFAIDTESSIGQGEGGSLEIQLGGSVESRLQGLIGNAWNDTRIAVTEESDTAKITNYTNVPIWASYPTAEQSADEGEIQNIIFIVLDAMAKPVIGAYRRNNDIFSTPYIDRFFSDALIYENCFSISEWTLSSLYSIFSSRYPVTHGYSDLQNLAPTDWGESTGGLAEVMRSHGFSTMACSTAKAFTPAFGAHAGFSRFFYDTYPESGRTSRLITDRAIDHLEANPCGKNFLFLHYIDTHEPWSDPSYPENCFADPIRTIDPFLQYSTLKTGTGDTKAEPIFNRESIEVLDRRLALRVKEVDLHLQSLFGYLEAKGLVDRTAVILTSDHGPAYPGGRNPLLADSRVRVPLLIKHPHFKGQRKSGMINQGLDLGPTIAKIGGANMRTSAGRVVAPIGEFEGREHVISESVFLDKYKVAVRNKEHTFHLHCKYDIATNIIQLDSVLETHLFQNNPNEPLDCRSEQGKSVSQQMMEIIRRHLDEHALAFRSFC